MSEQKNTYKCQMRSIQEVWMPPRTVEASSARAAAESYCNNNNLHINYQKVRVTDSAGAVTIFELQRTWKVNTILTGTQF